MEAFSCLNKSLDSPKQEYCLVFDKSKIYKLLLSKYVNEIKSALKKGLQTLKINKDERQY